MVKRWVGVYSKVCELEEMRKEYTKRLRKKLMKSNESTATFYAFL